jgi:hypothetical protein
MPNSKLEQLGGSPRRADLETMLSSLIGNEVDDLLADVQNPGDVGDLILRMCKDPMNLAGDEQKSNLKLILWSHYPTSARLVCSTPWPPDSPRRSGLDQMNLLDEICCPSAEDLMSLGFTPEVLAEVRRERETLHTVSQLAS